VSQGILFDRTQEEKCSHRRVVTTPWPKCYEDLEMTGLVKEMQHCTDCGELRWIKLVGAEATVPTTRRAKTKAQPRRRKRQSQDMTWAGPLKVTKRDGTVETYASTEAFRENRARRDLRS
jgi:hypothetical protein